MNRWFSPGRLWLALGILLAAYAAVGWSVPDPELAQFSGDIGVKLIQIDNLVRGHAWLDYPGAELDPSGRLFPLGPPFIVVHGGKPYSVYLNPVTYLAASVYPQFGIQGGRLLVLLCALGTVLATVWLARAVGLGRRQSLLVGSLALFATPLWLYGWVLWEHVPATLLCTVAAAAVLHEPRGAFPRWSLGAAVALGVGMACRPEALLFALALALAVAWVGRRPTVAAVLIVGTPIVYALTVLSLPGMPFLENASLILDKVFGWWTDPTAREPRLAERITIVESLLIGVLAPIDSPVPATARRVALGLSTVLLGFGVMRQFGGRPSEWSSGRLSRGIAAVAGLLLVGSALSLAVDRQILLGGLLICCPLALAAILGARQQQLGSSRQARGMSILGVTAVGFLFAALLLAQNGGGNQWGPRYLLPAMPFIACLAASRLELTRWGSAGGRVRGLTLIALIIASLAIQALGMRTYLLSRQHKAAAWERVAALEGDVFLTPAWFLPQEAAGLALRENTPVLLAPSREQMAYALDRLARAGTSSFTFLEIAGETQGIRRFGRYKETESTEFYLHPFEIRSSRFELSP